MNPPIKRARAHRPVCDDAGRAVRPAARPGSDRTRPHPPPASAAASAPARPSLKPPRPKPPRTSTTVVVTGLRASLESALNKKREDAGIVDVIKAEDIAKFPDTNLAESLQRIPGVVIDRDAGEGRNITVRGLGLDFTRVRINGVEALATTGGTDSSGGANRSPRLRLQRLRLRTVQLDHRAQERLGRRR